jgi:hypothetical protein
MTFTGFFLIPLVPVRPSPQTVALVVNFKVKLAAEMEGGLPLSLEKNP